MSTMSKSPLLSSRRTFLAGAAGALVAGPAAATEFARMLPVIPANASIYKPLSYDVADRAGPWGSSSRRFAGELAKAVFEEVNLRRRSHGLAVVRPDAPLARVAGLYSAEMIQGDFFGHNSPDGRNLDDRLSAKGLDQTYAEVAENLWNAEGRLNWFVRDNTRRAINDWLASDKGHREAMLDANLTLAGVGAALREERIAVAMLFGRR